MVTCIVAVIVGRGRGARVSPAEALVAVRGVGGHGGLLQVVEHLLAEGGGGREPLALRRRRLQFPLSISNERERGERTTHELIICNELTSFYFKSNRIIVYALKLKWN